LPPSALTSSPPFQVECLKEVIANDLAPEAVETIKRNVEFAKCGEKVTPNEGDAIMVMMQHSRDPAKQFDVVDLDPYGSAAPFLDSAVQSVCDGGMLMVTCTDLAVLCGNHPDICFAKYNAQALKKGARHEAAVRIALASIQSAALRYGRCIKPIAALQIDFYLRVFVIVKDSKIECKEAAPKIAVQYTCDQCESYHLQPFGRQTRDGAHPQYWPAHASPFQAPCRECGGDMLVGGPLYCGDLGDSKVLDKITEALSTEAKRTAGKDSDDKKGYAWELKSIPRLRALFGGLREELNVPGIDGCLHMNLVSMCQSLGMSSVPTGLVYNALEKAGYKVSHSHTDSQALKTDCPMDVLWDLMRCLRKRDEGAKSDVSAAGECKKKKKEGKAEKKKKSHAYPQLINKEPVHTDWDFSSEFHRLCGKERKKVGEGEVYAPMFPQNPEKGWGPKKAASSNRFEKEEAEREGKKQKKEA